MGLLRQADVDLGKGSTVPDVRRRLGISQQTYYRWRTQFGGMGSEDGEAGSGVPEGELDAEEACSGPGPIYADPQGGSPPTRLRAAGQLTCHERLRPAGKTLVVYEINDTGSRPSAGPRYSG